MFELPLTTLAKFGGSLPPMTQIQCEMYFNPVGGVCINMYASIHFI